MTNDNIQLGEFDKYLTQIYDPQDSILFNDAIKSANMGMFRSAYILAWLCCAESLKHKFQIASHHGDIKSNDIYQKITSAEGNHKAVDKYILERAKAHGFINDLEFDKLFIIYKMRCVYAHPYKNAPSKENVLSALSDIVNIVLSKPAMLSEGFIDELIDKLINDINYLNDYQETVKNEIQNWLSKINPHCYKYFIENYSEKIESCCNDRAKVIIIKRAKWIVEGILQTVQYNIYTNEEWHNYIRKYPNFSVQLAVNNKDFFMSIGERAQDYLISTILEKSIYTPWYLQIFIQYFENMQILRDNYDKILTFIKRLPLNALKLSGLEFKYCAASIIKDLESGFFDRQNSATAFVQENEQAINTLDENMQFLLGKNINIAANNNAWQAQNYINKIISNPNIFPLEFLRGICSVVIDEAPERSYILLRKNILNNVNLLINNLENKEEIANYVNSLLNRYANSEIVSENYAPEEIKKHLQTEKYEWIELLV